MKYILFFTLLITSPYLFAQLDCKATPSKSIDIKSDNKGSLHGALIQDQDGLGTCYANAASLALEAYFNKPISPHFLALADKYVPQTSENRLNGIGVANRSIMQDGKFFTEGGNSCTAIYKAKEYFGKVCQTQDVLIEQITGEKQASFFKALGQFYDTISALPKGRKELLKTELMKAKEYAISIEQADCNDKKKLQSKAKTALQGVFKSLYIHKGYEEIRKSQLGSHKVNDETSKTSVELTPQMLLEIDELLDNLQGKNIKLNTYKEMESFIHSLIKKSFPDVGPGVYQSDFFILEVAKHYIPDILSFMDPKRCKSYSELSLYKGLYQQQCLTNLNIFDITQELSTIFFGGPELIDQFIQHIQGEKKFDEFFRSMIGGKCEENGLVIPPKLNCNEVSIPLQKSISKSSDEQRSDAKKYFRTEIFNQLHKKMPNGSIGNPVVINYCTRVLKEKSFDYNWGNGDDKKCSGIGKHSYHSSAIIGMRCHNGKIEYLIQNSWGKDSSMISNPDITTNNNKGSFWISEDDAVNSSTSLNFLTF